MNGRQERVDQVIYALADFTNALEAASIGLRNHLKDLAQVVDYDLNQLVREQREGSSGPYQAATEAANSEPPKHGHWQALLKDLREHDEKITREGYFIWLFQDERTVGRKKRKW
ncbi:MAG: hypothetical protein GWN86_14085 [Desulfobacterales bacterium]|nr:hypothetical protein [Desulfobacterales bacterium]